MSGNSGAEEDAFNCFANYCLGEPEPHPFLLGDALPYKFNHYLQDIMNHVLPAACEPAQPPNGLLPSSQDPILGHSPSTIPQETRPSTGSQMIGTWNSPVFGLCQLFAVPSSIPVEGIPGAIIVGFINGRPIWVLPH